MLTDFKFGESQLDPSQMKTQRDGGLELVKSMKEVIVCLTYINSNVDQISLKTDLRGFKTFAKAA